MACAAPSLAGQTNPATAPGDRENQTPLQALLRGARAFDTSDTEAGMKAFHWRGEAEENLVRQQVQTSIAVARLEAAVRVRHGKDAAAACEHALDEKSEEDLEEAKIVTTGQTASVQYKGDLEPEFTMIRINGTWLVDAHAALDAMKPEERTAYIQSMKIIRDGLPAIVHEIETGKLSDTNDIVKKLSEIYIASQKPYGALTK
jgi:hypothetical protein